jgi:hypothetical protein
MQAYLMKNSQWRNRTLIDTIALSLCQTPMKKPRQ